MSPNCPRCDSTRTECMTRAPGVWEVLLCGQCFYSWRTSEPAAMLRYDTYDPRFRLTAEQIARFTAFPPVPRRTR